MTGCSRLNRVEDPVQQRMRTRGRDVSLSEWKHYLSTMLSAWTLLVRISLATFTALDPPQ